MNFDKNRHIGQNHGDVCPVTGLPVLRKPEWTDVGFGKDYRVTVSIVGDNILRVQPSGYVTLDNQINVLKLTEQAPAEAISGGEQYIHIEDWSNFQGASLAARKHYMDEMQARKRISGVIFCNVSYMFKMSIKLGKALRMVKFPVHLVDDYSEAVRLALEIQSKGNVQEDKPVIAPLNKKDVPINVFPSDEESACPVTSLPVTTRPEWTDIPIDDNYSVSFSLIGNAILRVVPNGTITDAGTRRLVEERDKVLKDVGLKGKRYAEIWDHSLIARKPSKKSLLILTNLLLEETNEGSLVGFWVFNAPLTIRLMFDVGVRLHKPSAPVGAVKGYREAAENAVNVLDQNGIDVGIRQYKRFTKDDWHFELENYGIRFELIGDDIIYTVAHGSLKEAYVGKLFDINEKVLEEAGLTAKGYYYRIINWENLQKTTWKARSMYIDGIRDLNRKVPCKLSVVFGLNKFMKAIVGFSKQFIPVPVTNARDFEEAMAIILREKKRGSETRIPKMKRRTEETPQDEKIRNYCDELLGFMGVINWEQEGTAWEGVSDSHPFKSVYDAMAIIKEDVDDLFQSRKQAEEKIRQYSENLEEMVKERTEELAKSEEKYRTILENIEDGYYEVDFSGNLTFFNDAACRITGYSEDELMGMNHREYTDEENASKLYREYNKVYETGIPTKRLDWEVIKEDGTTGFLEGSISVMTDSEDQSIGFRGIIRDVTERKELDREIMEKRRQAEEANKAKSQFLANMSHEIRTPLNGIVGMAELALDTRLDDNQKNIFHTINTEANALQDVINEVLDFSKIEAGKFDLEEIPFDLRVTIEDMAASFAYRAEQKGLDFISFLAPDVPSRLIGDPVRLRQIMVNLTGNAIKFTRAGALYVKGELVEKIEDRVKIRFSVKDTGIGIPDARHATIFDSFTQADGSTTRNYGGTGLGTTISKQLAEMMGGEIGLESEVGKGSTFWFTALFGEQEEKKQIPAAIDLDLNNLKVLIVDDNQTNRFVLMEYVKSWGCLPVEAVDAKEALIVFRDAVSSESPFDLILTDFQMPEMSGFDLVKEIKTMETLKEVPIIVLTSSGRKGDGRNCKEIGVNGYLTKPIRQNELRKAIVSVLGLSTGRKTGSLPELVTRHSVTEDYRKEIQILLVEDYPTNQQVAMRHLIKGGYQVDLAEDGSQAVKAYKRKNYNLIFMDIQMPIMDGYAATQEIREIETRNLEQSSIINQQSSIQRVPIIAMTAHAIKGYRERCLEAGMDDYIAKPLRRKELLTIVEKWTSGIDDCIAPRGNQESEAPMEYAKALEEFEGDEEFLMEVLEGFIGNVTSQIKLIRQAISDGDAEAVRREAHSIKGGAANLTANDLSGIAFEIENIGKSGMLEGSIDALQKLEREFFRLERFVTKRDDIN